MYIKINELYLMKRKIVLMLTSLMFFGISFAQNTKKGDNAFDRGEYHKAVQEYTSVEDKVSDPALKSHSSYRIAESYRRMNAPEKAEPYYEKAIRAGYMGPDVYFGYGEVLLKQAKYDEAKKQFESFKRANPEDKLVDAKIASCAYGKAVTMLNPQFKLLPIETINSKGSEYGIAYFNDALIYASTGAESGQESKLSTRTGLPYSKFYMSYPLNDVYGKGELAVGLNKQNNVNEGTFAYDPVNGLGYYTRCDGNKGSQCFIYFAEFKNNQWKEKDYLAIESRKVAIGHPFVTPEGDRIYFTSAMEGGYGKADLWFTNKLPDGTWSKPINLGGDVNTAGDDVFPFVADGYLFFASDGHPGFGGLDIYASKIDGNIHGKPVNLGLPFNSAQDDFNLIVKYDNKEGMLVSARRPEYNDDIYRFKGFPSALMVSGRIYDSVTNIPMVGAPIEVKKDGKTVNKLTSDDSGKYVFYVQPDSLYELSSLILGYDPVARSYTSINERFGEMENWDLPMQSSAAFLSGIITAFERKRDGTTVDLGPLPHAKAVLFENGTQSVIVETDAKGEYRFANIKENTQYKVLGAMEGYLSDTKEQPIGLIPRSIDFCKATGYDMDMQLEKIQEVIQLQNILYDYAKYDLRPESKLELDKFVDMLNKNPDLKVEIRSHTDDRGSLAANDKLSQNRAKSVVEYLKERGISEYRLDPKGYGERDLLIKRAKNEEEHQQNRRTEFAVIGKTGESLYDTNMAVSQSISANQIPLYGAGTPVQGYLQSPQQQGLYTPPQQQQPQYQPQQQVPVAGTSIQNMPFRIQVGAVSRVPNMSNSEYQKIKQQFNLDVYYEQSGAIYRVFAGGFNSMVDAKAMADRMNRALGTQYFPKAK